MTQNNKYIGAVILLILVIALCSFYLGKNSSTTGGNTATTTDIVSENPDTDDIDKTSTSTTGTSGVKPATGSTSVKNGAPAGYYSYANAEYNFTMQYPSYVKIRNGFSTFHEIGNNWRLYPAQANQGKPVVSFAIYNVDQGTYSTGKQTYPLYFTSEVRVGVSPNTKECYTPDAGYANQKVTNVTINGIAFKKFSTADAGMMKYTQAESYRTIHNKMCFAIEQIKSGSSYRDELMKSGVAETTLTNYYNLGETIVKTFKFTK